MDSNMTHEDKKRRDELHSLIYLKQYERRIAAHYTLATKQALWFMAFMGYQIYYDTMMPIASYGIVIAGLVFIYRNMVKHRYYETEEVFAIKKLSTLFNFLLRKGKEKDRRYIDVNKIKKQIIKAEKKKKNAKKKKKNTEKILTQE